MDLNKVMLGGRMVADPNLITLPNGTALSEFRVAVNRKWTDKDSEEKREESCFLDVKCFGKMAPVINQHFHKGKPIFIEGHLRQESWEKDGQKRTRIVVILDSFEFLGTKDKTKAGQDDEPQAP